MQDWPSAKSRLKRLTHAESYEAGRPFIIQRARSSSPSSPLGCQPPGAPGAHAIVGCVSLPAAPRPVPGRSEGGKSARGTHAAGRPTPRPRQNPRHAGPSGCASAPLPCRLQGTMRGPWERPRHLKGSFPTAPAQGRVPRPRGTVKGQAWTDWGQLPEPQRPGVESGDGNDDDLTGGSGRLNK